jgi:sulfate/thiosulfate transport system permease protein
MAGGAAQISLVELRSRPGHDSLLGKLLRWLLIGISLLFLAALLIAPLITVFATALEKGIRVYLAAFQDPNTISAIKLTLITAAVVVPLNTIFGLSAAWCIAKFEFPGKSFFTTLIDLPLAVSPVIAGLVYVLVFGRQGWFGGWLEDHNISIIFALPGIILATMFVTFPYVARELIPLMQQLGNDEEEAAITLGAGAWQTFFRVTLPKVRWGLIYGIILCNASGTATRAAADRSGHDAVALVAGRQ